MRKTLMKQISTLPTDPELPREPAALAGWLEAVERGVEEAVARLGIASGAQLGTAEPRLRTAILPTTEKKYDVKPAVCAMSSSDSDTHAGALFVGSVATVPGTTRLAAGWPASSVRQSAL